MKSLTNILAFTLILSLMAAVVYGMYKGTLLVWTHIDVLSHSTKVILISATATALLSAIIFAYGLRSAALVKLRSQLASPRHELYVHVLGLLRDIMDPDCGAAQREEFADELARAHADFLMLASTSSIKAYLAFQQSFDKGEYELLEPCFQTVWKNLRKDLGFTDDFDVIDVKQLINILPRQEKLSEPEKQMLPT